VGPSGIDSNNTQEKMMKKTMLKVAGTGLLAGLSVLLFGASPASAEAPTTGPQTAQSSASGDGVIAGNSGAATVAIPVEICGNGVGVGILGGGGGLGLCEISLFSSGGDNAPTTGAQTAQSSAEGDGLGTGNTGAVTWATPVEFCGNGGGGGGAGIGIGVGACDIDAWSH
jgi:hypothetical protein